MAIQSANLAARHVIVKTSNAHAADGLSGAGAAAWLGVGFKAFAGVMHNLTFTVVPVPAAFPMLAAALAGLGVIRRRAN